jgi:hypothetical protein
VFELATISEKSLLAEEEEEESIVEKLIRGNSFAAAGQIVNGTQFFLSIQFFVRCLATKYRFVFAHFYATEFQRNTHLFSHLD